MNNLAVSLVSVPTYITHLFERRHNLSVWRPLGCDPGWKKLDCRRPARHVRYKTNKCCWKSNIHYFPFIQLEASSTEESNCVLLFTVGIKKSNKSSLSWTFVLNHIYSFYSNLYHLGWFYSTEFLVIYWLKPIKEHN